MLVSVVLLALVASTYAICGTEERDLSCLKAATDYKLPIDSPCNLPQCVSGKLPWNIYFNMCQALQTEKTTNCAGALACQSWPGETASLGTFASVTYADSTTFDGVVVRADQGSVANGIARSMVLNIICDTKSEEYPSFKHEATATLEYTFEWKRTEACKGGCGGSPTNPPGPGSHSGSGHGLATGSWCLIFLLICIVVYLIGGMLFMAVVKGARGVEMVPNLTFWSSFPGLVADGCKFTYAKIFRRGEYSSVV